MEEININFDDNLDTDNTFSGLKIDNFDLNNDIDKQVSNEGSKSTFQPSVNSGGGLELLMNEKRKENIGNNEKKSNDIRELENEIENIDNSNVFNIKSDAPIEMNDDDNDNDNDNDNDIGKSTIKLGDNSNKVTSTWDGYKNINKVINSADIDETPVMTKEEMLREKFNILRKLEALEKKGVQFTKKYTMESNLMEMKGEYENIIAEKEKKNSVKFQGKVLTALITGVEFLNNRFDPFEFNLDGWSEQVNENLDDYDDIFGELYEKYKSKASMSPEMKLIFQLAASGMMIHMTNSMFKSSVPGMDDIMKQNPDLMQQFTNAAMSSMNQSNPGTSQFMNEFSNRGQKPPTNDNSFVRDNVRDFFPNQSNERESRPEPRERTERQQKSSRREMKGPSNDINDLLSGLKKKTTVQEEEIKNDSIISLEDMNNLNKPKKGRKKKNEKNTISLDL